MLVKNESISKLPIKLLESCSTILAPKQDKSLIKSSLLPTSLNLNIWPKKRNHPDYLVNFGLFYKDNHNFQVLSAEDLHFIKTKTEDIHCLLFVLVKRMCLNICQKENLML